MSHPTPHGLPLRKQLIVLSAPSGGGKTTVARRLLEAYPQLRFSVSATTRQMRPGETHGKDYFFLSHEEFLRRIDEGDLLEYEEIFGNLYGTLRSEVERSLHDGVPLIFDVDVKGALSVRKAFPDDTLLMFISPPDMAILEQRLRARSTESDEQIRLRLARAAMEMQYIGQFDIVIINDDLQKTLLAAEQAVQPE